MLYKLLGMVIWKLGKRILRRSYGPTYVPKPVAAGAVLLLALGIVALAARRPTDT